MANANKDSNSVAVALLTSNVDGKTPIRWLGDPVTGRALVDVAAGGITKLVATGTVDGVNAAFTFIQLPTFIVSDGVWYEETDSNGVTQWSWNSGTLTATMTIPPTGAIFGIA